MRKLATVTAVLCLVATSAVSQELKMSQDVSTVAPALEKYTDDILLGDVWKRPGLTARDRSIVTIAALIARNQTVEMAFYVNRALDSGVKPAEISEVITHLAFYAGRANAVSAAGVVKDVFAARKMVPANCRRRLRSCCRSTRPRRRTRKARRRPVRRDVSGRDAIHD